LLPLKRPPQEQPTSRMLAKELIDGERNAVASSVLSRSIAEMSLLEASVSYFDKEE
jgi:hypothetical protein